MIYLYIPFGVETTSRLIKRERVHEEISMDRAAFHLACKNMKNIRLGIIKQRADVNQFD